MTLNPELRKMLDSLDEFTESSFDQSQYASMILPPFWKEADGGHPVTSDDVAQWAREREWSEERAGWMRGVAFAVRYSDREPAAT